MGEWSLEQFGEAIRGRRNPCNDLVSVVIPAWNAETTIDETLRSVRAQTHENIEILVVDDGSADRTGEIIQEHMKVDCRVGMIRQSNCGVAEARNRGAREARGQILAFIDADDLWSPDKIQKQLAALWAGGPQTKLVYCWYALIDRNRRVIDASYQPTDSGDVLERICRENFIGNGSSVLLTRLAFDEAGGFDPTFRTLGAQGCEDWQFYFKIAERHRFGLVPETLTGYRRRPGAMSEDLPRMLRSSNYLAMFMRGRQPALGRSIEVGCAYYAGSLLAKAIARGRLLTAGQLSLMLLFRTTPARAARAALATFRAIVANRARAMVSDQDPRDSLRFTIGEPKGHGCSRSIST
jgi:glycosyltransferase involved in cell wall biosynthesis